MAAWGQRTFDVASLGSADDGAQMAARSPRPALPAVGSRSCPLGLCDGGGFLVDEETNTASDCRCRQGQIARTRATRLEARIPRRYRDISLEQLEGSILAPHPEPVGVARRFISQIAKNLDEGRGIWIMGDVGTGKTSLAMTISKAALDAGRTAAIYSLPRLMSLIRESIEDDAGVLGFLDLLSTVDLLHLDDLGAQVRTDWTIEQFYSIINARYADQRSIVFTTNLTPDELQEQVGARIFSRLVEMCGDPLPLYGPDRRRELQLPELTA